MEFQTHFGKVILNRQKECLVESWWQLSSQHRGENQPISIGWVGQEWEFVVISDNLLFKGKKIISEKIYQLENHVTTTTRYNTHFWASMVKTRIVSSILLGIWATFVNELCTKLRQHVLTRSYPIIINHVDKRDKLDERGKSNSNRRVSKAVYQLTGHWRLDYHRT